MHVTPAGIFTEVRLLQPQNAFEGTDSVQPNSISYPPPMGPAVFRPLQAKNAFVPMFATLPGIVTDVRPLHLLNALLPMPVTLPGIFTEVSHLQLQNA